MDRKLSIRFYKDREVRAVWDGEHNKWWFSVLDIIGVLNEQDDYSKNRNYWKYLKTKLKKEDTELVSTTNQLKMQAKDGTKKRRLIKDYILLISSRGFLIPYPSMPSCLSMPMILPIGIALWSPCIIYNPCMIISITSSEL